jgi:hypothetical protein
MTQTPWKPAHPIQVVPFPAEENEQLAFIRALTPYFHTAYKAGELHIFYDMVLTMWFDVWPELSQNPLVQQHNRFVSY